MKRLAVFLDGTWNEPGDNTNVWRLRSMLAHNDRQHNRQLAYYDTGVGTRWYDRFRGGVAGTGLAANIRQAYQWLIEHFEDGDEIYMFGFSRGAFSARSLAGMISKCGLLTPGSPMPVLQAYERYENVESKPLYRLPGSITGRTDLTQEDKWMVQYSRKVRIKFIGVWDTVGTLGVKLRRTRQEQRGEFNQHFTRLSKLYDHAYQALAIDEHRKPYPLSRWYQFIPEKAPDKVHEAPPYVEQRWFVGAHSNIGGGYRDDPLPQLPLNWIKSKAELAGLEFRHALHLTGDEHLATPVDSYAKFLKGAYRIIKFGKRAYRVIGEKREEVVGGWIEPHFETIDGSVFEKYRADARYRPPNLADWARRAELRIEDLAETQATSQTLKP